jgi:hypothetical protein
MGRWQPLPAWQYGAQSASLTGSVGTVRAATLRGPERLH